MGVWCQYQYPLLLGDADAVKNLGQVKSRQIDWQLVAQALGVHQHNVAQKSQQ